MLNNLIRSVTEPAAPGEINPPHVTGERGRGRRAHRGSPHPSSAPPPALWLPALSLSLALPSSPPSFKFLFLSTSFLLFILLLFLLLSSQPHPSLYLFSVISSSFPLLCLIFLPSHLPSFLSSSRFSVPYLLPSLFILSHPFSLPLSPTRFPPFSFSLCLSIPLAPPAFTPPPALSIFPTLPPTPPLPQPKPTSSFYEPLNTSFNQLHNFNFTQLSARMSDEVVKTPQIADRGDRATRPPPTFPSSSQPSLSPAPTHPSPSQPGRDSRAFCNCQSVPVDVSLVISVKLPEWPHYLLTPNLEAIFLFKG